MIGTWRINAWTAVIGAVLTGAVNLGRNPADAAAIRALAAAAVFWALAYGLRIMLKQTLPQPDHGMSEEPATGRHLDLAAGDEDLNQLLKQELQAHSEGAPRAGSSAAEVGSDISGNGFRPLHPPQLKSVASDMEPEELVQAVRQLSRDEE